MCASQCLKFCVVHHQADEVCPSQIVYSGIFVSCEYSIRQLILAAMQRNVPHIFLISRRIRCLTYTTLWFSIEFACENHSNRTPRCAALILPPISSTPSFLVMNIHDRGIYLDGWSIFLSLYLWTFSDHSSQTGIYRKIPCILWLSEVKTTSLIHWLFRPEAAICNQDKGSESWSMTEVSNLNNLTIILINTWWVHPSTKQSPLTL